MRGMGVWGVVGMERVGTFVVDRELVGRRL